MSMADIDITNDYSKSKLKFKFKPNFRKFLCCPKMNLKTIDERICILVS